MTFFVLRVKKEESQKKTFIKTFSSNTNKACCANLNPNKKCVVFFSLQ